MKTPLVTAVAVRKTGQSAKNRTKDVLPPTREFTSDFEYRSLRPSKQEIKVNHTPP